MAEYFTKTAVKERGWTDKAIADFLGDPDQKVKGMYRSSPPTQLFLTSRVMEVEQSEAFCQWQESSKGRREKASSRMKARMSQEREQTVAWVNNYKLKIPKWDEKKLFEEACLHYAGNKADYLESRGRDSFDVAMPDPETCDRSFLERITVNFLRHECTPYDSVLEKATGLFPNNKSPPFVEWGVLLLVAVSGQVLPRC